MTSAANDDIADSVLRRSLALFKDSQVLLRELPKDLPFKVPMPEGSRVLASVVNFVNGEKYNISILLDGPPQEKSQLLAFCEKTMVAQGWRVVERDNGMGPVGQVYFASSHDEVPQVMAQILPGAGHSLDLGFHVEMQKATPSSSRFSADNWGPLPSLSLPREIGGMMPRSKSSSPNSFESVFVVHSDASLGDLSEINAQQFRASGWNERGSGSEGHCAWKQWDYQANDEEFQASVLLTESIDPIPRTLLLKALRVSSEPLFAPPPPDPVWGPA